MEVMLWHWDGYVMNRNNFRIYHDRDSNRMVFLPHGLDQILTKPDGPIFPQAAGLVARSVLEIPECQRRYRERMAQLLTNVFNFVAITNHIHQASDKIDAVLAETDPQGAAAHQQRVLRFCRRLQQRVHSLERQLSPVPVENPSQFDNAGIMTIAEWQPKIDLGNPQLNAGSREGQNSASHQYPGAMRSLLAKQHTAGWRTVYRLVARMKTQGIVLGRTIKRQAWDYAFPGVNSVRKFPETRIGPWWSLISTFRKTSPTSNWSANFAPPRGDVGFTSSLSN